MANQSEVVDLESKPNDKTTTEVVETETNGSGTSKVD